MASRKRAAKKRAAAPKQDCFVIMPISDPDGYTPGHFAHVFEDIVRPACESAGYSPVRADQVRQTNLIHLDVLQRLLESPLAICDLSSRNPNVLFELGLRQAFDKPVVLIQEAGTQPIFDIAPLRYTEYRRARTYHEVLEDQETIATAIRATAEAWKEGQGVNSLVKILALTQPAALPEVKESDSDPTLQIIRAELEQLRFDISRALRRSGSATQRSVWPEAREASGGTWGFPIQSRAALEDALATLSPRASKVVRLSLGLDAEKPMELGEIAALMGVPIVSVRRILHTSMRRIRDAQLKSLK